MSEDSTATADVIFCDALEQPPGERSRFVHDACAGDVQLEEEVLSLLVAHPEAQSFLDSPLAVDALRELAGDGPDPLIGATLGAYRVVERIGAGGMGAVYLGERADAEFEKRVAIKVIKRGMDTDDILHRFRTERQVLADLEHPHIARLLDGGATPDGRPFLIMEYVEGERIDAFCDAQRLSIDRRLDFFIELCEAVQYAHQNFVVHRDLKPSNVLVTKAGDLKLLDFGIAKVLDADANVRPEVTATRSRQLTPAYASPEQLRGQSTTTASDVYSLGVILYELLTGRHPFHERTGTAAELEHAICEELPAAPSTMFTQILEGNTARVDQVCASRSTDPTRLKQRLRGDLETILLKALRKEPDRRYSSVEQLAEDIHRHRTGLPVSARPDTFGYRASKFVRRNRAGVFAATLITMSLIGGLVASLLMYSDAERARVRETTARVRAEATSTFLRSLLSSIDPENAQGRDVSLLRELLDDAADRLEFELGAYPDAARSMHLTIGQTYNAIAAYDKAERHLEQAIQLARVHQGDQSAAMAEALSAIGVLYGNTGRHEEAEQALTEALAIRRVLPVDVTATAETLRMLGVTAQAQSDYVEAERLMNNAVTALRERSGGPDIALATALKSLASLLADREQGEAAVAAMAESLEIRQVILPENHPLLGRAHHGMGWALRRNGEPAKAETHYRKALAINRAVLPERHPNLASSLNHLAGALEDQKEFEEVESLYVEALAIFEHNHGDAHQDVGTAHNNIALFYVRQGRLEEAALHYERAIDIYKKTLGPDHVFVAILLMNALGLYDRQGRLLKAEDELREWRRLVEIYWDPGDPREIYLRNTEAAMLMEQGHLREAEPVLIGTFNELDELIGRNVMLTQAALQRLVRLYTKLKQPTEADRYRALLSPEE